MRACKYHHGAHSLPTRSLLPSRTPQHRCRHRDVRRHAVRDDRPGRTCAQAAHLIWHAVGRWLLCGAIAAAPAWAAVHAGPDASDETHSPAASPATEALDFDIPSQPLADALKRYASLTQRPALFRSELVDGRISSAVRGLYTPEAALRLLLDGTGLLAENAATRSGVAFVLKAESLPEAAPRAAALGRLSGYPGQVQARVWAALCGDARTAPGAYRSLLRFEVDAAGRLLRPRLLGGTGDVSRDAAMVAALQRVRMDRSPPPDMPQPVTMLILPAAGDRAAEDRRCAGDDAGKGEDGASWP